MSGNDRRWSYPADFKLKVVWFAKEHGNKAASREFGSPPTKVMIGRWQKEEERSSKLPRMKRAVQEKNATWPNLEKKLTHWLQSQTMSGISVSNKMIMDQRRRIAIEMEERTEEGETKRPVSGFL